jgi:thymidylate kinase
MNLHTDIAQVLPEAYCPGDDDHTNAIPADTSPVILGLLRSLEEKKVRYCHWKSNIRLHETLAASEDIDLLVDRRDGAIFQTTLLEYGFKLAHSRSGTGHPGVFHALGLDEEKGALVDLHAYHQVVSGDSLVKNYRLPIDSALLDHTRHLFGVRVPTPEAELVVFALRIVLKHVSIVEVLKANIRYSKTAHELNWLRTSADLDNAQALCATWFPQVGPTLFRQALEAIATERALVRRIVVGTRIAWRLRGLRRLGAISALSSRLWRLFAFTAGRFLKRRDLTPQPGGIIVALVGPKATGKSTLGRALAEILGKHFDVVRIHAGKPPATLLSIIPRLCVPIARSLLPHERIAEYERPERREERRYPLLHVVRMTLLAYDRRRLLRRALRMATRGIIVISDRYPSESTAAIDSSCFDDTALARSQSALKRWLMARERALYRDIPRPNLVLRLVAPVETALHRDALRNKAGGPDADAVRRRWELESSADFPGTPVICINTDQPLDDTIRAAIRAVWKVL